jgi:hypothetical protein
LLGLDLFEDDREKIDEVSMLLMARVLEHDPGPHCEAARRIFDELDAARNCLCNSETKQAYDARLRERRSIPAAAAASAAGQGTTNRKKSWGSLAPRGSSVLHAERDAASVSTIGPQSSGSSIGRRADTPKPSESPAESARGLDRRRNRLASLALGLVLLVGLVSYLLLREPSEHDPVPDLVAQLSDPDIQQRIAAAQALRKLGPRASDALPQLVQSLSQETNEHVRLALAQAVREAGPGTIRYSRDFEIIKMRETNPGVLQVLNELLMK